MSLAVVVGPKKPGLGSMIPRMDSASVQAAVTIWEPASSEVGVARDGPLSVFITAAPSRAKRIIRISTTSGQDSRPQRLPVVVPAGHGTGRDHHRQALGSAVLAARGADPDDPLRPARRGCDEYTQRAVPGNPHLGRSRFPDRDRSLHRRGVHAWDHRP